MSLTTLIGTTWALKNTLNTYAGGTYYWKEYSINFTTAEEIEGLNGKTPEDTFNLIGIGYDTGAESNHIMYSGVPKSYYVIASGNDIKTVPDTWNRIINVPFTITGGDDAANADLIAWLEANADLIAQQEMEYIATLTDLSSVANAIRTKAGLSVMLTFPADFVTAIANIPTGSDPKLQSKMVSPDVLQQTVLPDSGYDGLSSVTVDAMPTGTAGTPSAVKGVVSNNSVTITPSVMNSSGYITGGKKTGSAVTVRASELVNGAKQINISSAGTTTEDVTNYASAEITVPAGSAGGDTSTKTVAPTISVDSAGLITASNSSSIAITTPVSPGYVTSGQSSTVNVTGSATVQLPVYAGEHHSVVTGYTVRISLTNPQNSGEFGYCNVDVDGNTRAPISISSPTGSVDVVATSSIRVIIDGMSVSIPMSGITCTGGVSNPVADSTGCYNFVITGDGTITFDGIDYDD